VISRLGEQLESVLVAGLTILHIGLGGHAENNDVAFAFKFLRQTLSANEATLVVVRANEKEPLAGGGVRVDRENGDTRCNGLINAVLEEGRIRNGQQDARGILLHRLIQSFSLGLGVVRLGARETIANLPCVRRFGKASAGSLPIRNLQVGGYENIIFVGLVRRTTAEKR
jgi:hypothetical protein